MKYKSFCVFLLQLCICQLQADDSPLTLFTKSREVLNTNPSLAIHYAEQILNRHASDAADERLQTDALLLMAKAEKLLGDFDSSMKFLYDALDMCPEVDKTAKGDIFLQLAFTYTNMADHNKAFEFNDKATALYKSMGDSTRLADCYNVRGLIHCNLHEFTEAEQFFRKSLYLNRKFKNLSSAAANLNNMCLYKGDLKEKLQYINEAISINKNLMAVWSLGENYNNKGKQYFYAGQYENALEALATAMEIAESIPSRELICDNYEYRAWVYYAMKAYKQAYDCQANLLQMRDRLQSAQKLRNIEQGVIQKRLEAKERENHIRAQEYEIRLWHRNSVLLVALLGILLILAAYISLWYKRRKNMELMESRCCLEKSERQIAELMLQQQKQELMSIREEYDINRHELTTFAMFLCSRNEVLEKIREMVKEGYRMDDQHRLAHLKKVNTFIGQTLNNDQANSSLLSNIEEKNAEFIARLTRLHPDLTVGERYLATLLRVNLSTKDIAVLTGRQPKTINMSRYRLRKTLCLDNETDLSEYLQKI